MRYGKAPKQEKKLILNKQNTVYYHFFENQLYGVSYTLQAEDTKQICAKFTNKVDILKVPATTKEEWIDNLIAQRMIDNKEDNAIINLASNKMILKSLQFLSFTATRPKRLETQRFIFMITMKTQEFIYSKTWSKV